MGGQCARDRRDQRMFDDLWKRVCFYRDIEFKNYSEALGLAKRRYGETCSKATSLWIETGADNTDALKPLVEAKAAYEQALIQINGDWGQYQTDTANLARSARWGEISMAQANAALTSMHEPTFARWLSWAP